MNGTMGERERERGRERERERKKGWVREKPEEDSVGELDRESIRQKELREREREREHA